MFKEKDTSFLNKIKKSIKKDVISDDRLISEKSRHSPKTELLISIKDSVILLMANLYSTHEQLYLINKALSKQMSISLETYKKFLESYLDEYLENHKKHRYLAARYLKIKKEVSKNISYEDQFKNLELTGNINATIKLDISLEDYKYFVKNYIETKKEIKNKVIAEHYIRVPTGKIEGPKIKVKKVKGDTLESVLITCKDNNTISPIEKKEITKKTPENKVIKQEIKKEEILIFKSHEEREKLKNNYGYLQLDALPGITVNSIPHNFELVLDKKQFPKEIVEDVDFMFAKFNSTSFEFSEPFIYLPDRRLINAINPNSYGLIDGLLFVCDTIRDEEYTTGYLFIRYYKNKLYFIQHFQDLTKSTELYIEFNRFTNNNFATSLVRLVDELYNLQ